MGSVNVRQVGVLAMMLTCGKFFVSFWVSVGAAREHCTTFPLEEMSDEGCAIQNCSDSPCRATWGKWTITWQPSSVENNGTKVDPFCGKNTDTFSIQCQSSKYDMGKKAGGKNVLDVLHVVGDQMTWLVCNIVYLLFLIFAGFVISAFVSLGLKLWLRRYGNATNGQNGEDAQSDAQPPEWILYGEVYDLRPFLSRHPGGALVLQQCQGTDCTALFASYHTLRTPYLGQLKDYRVRRAAKCEADVSEHFEWAHTPAHTAMRAGLRAHFQGKSFKAPTWVLVWYSAWLVALVLSTWRWLVAGELSAAAIMVCAMFYGAHDVVHHAAHLAIFESPKMNQLAANVCGFWITNTPAWVRQHNLLHHTHCNLEEDPDLHHFHFWYDDLSTWLQWAFFGCNPWASWRLSERTPMRSEYARWMYTVPFYMCFSTLALTIIEPPYAYLTQRCMNSDTRFVFTPGELALGWAQYATICSVLIYTTWVHGAHVALLPYMIEGVIFYVSTQLSHVNDASQVADASENEQKDEWAVHQLKTTRGDYNYDSWVWLALTQGLNLQSIHHVFPSVHWAHYPEIYRIVWAAGGEHRPPKSFHEIVLEHLAFVARMNAA